ncbi:MAG: tetratricopeptide repeat protein [Acidobacteria bacterium]|nr:tetratricopeptide repeat protein [Acidobacteriota bacterium]
MNVKQLEEKLATTHGVNEKLEVLDELASYYYDHDNYQKAITYYQEAEKLVPAGNSLAYYQGLEGICHFFLKKDKEAYQALLGAKEVLRPKEDDFDPEICGLVHYFLGSLYEYNEANDSSLECRLEAYEYLNHLHREAQWMLLAGMSRNYEQQGDLRKAVEFNTQAISLISNDDPEVVFIFESLGSSHYELGEYEKALEYFSRVLEVDAGFERKEDIYFSIGLCNQRLLDFRLALKSYLKLLELKELVPDGDSLCWLYIEIAHCYYSLKEHEKSIECVEKALSESIEDKEENAEIHSYLSNNYYALGKYQEAVEAGEATLKISDQFHNLKIMLPNLALSYYQLGQEDKFHFYRDWCNRAFSDLRWTKELNKLKI